ncbi:hypothetical protein [Streptomyces sp. NPDC002580]|uniref:hypothetical protein n=1 Tax=Streptomyces sp. NPDC002580 TaxID=3364653 RepID=UPI0036CAC856
MKLSPPGPTAVTLTVTTVMCVVGGAACFGFIADGWTGAVLEGSATAGGVAVGASLRRPRPLVTGRSAAPGGGDGSGAGAADAIVPGFASYEAAVFPLTSGGVSDEEKRARRMRAYRLAAYDELPRGVRVSAAEALGVLDEGADPHRARTVVNALSRAIRDDLPVRRPD